MPWYVDEGRSPDYEFGGRRFESFRARQVWHCYPERILLLRSPHLIWDRRKIREIGVIETGDSTGERVRPRAWIEKLAYSIEVFDRPDGSLIEMLPA